jgi:hypothetical protein
MNLTLNKKELGLLKMALDNEVIDFDQRLSLMENQGRGTGAYQKRCEMKVLASRVGWLKEAA